MLLPSLRQSGPADREGKGMRGPNDGSVPRWPGWKMATGLGGYSKISLKQRGYPAATGALDRHY